MLADYLWEEYTVVSLDFREIGTEEFLDIFAFTRAFARLPMNAFARNADAGTKLANNLEQFAGKDADFTLGELFAHISKICEVSSKSVVMMVDEVDTSNNQVLIDFLALFRSYYFDRKNKPIFHTVILVGVYDIKNLKLKVHFYAEHQYNSPWNIAAKFDIAMSWSRC